MTNDSVWYVRVVISFFLSAIIFVLLTALPLPGNETSYILDPTLHAESRQLIWLVSGIGVFVYFLRQSSDNLIGTFVCAIMGPVVILTMGFVWLSLKLFPMNKKDATNE